MFGLPANIQRKLNPNKIFYTGLLVLAVLFWIEQVSWGDGVRLHSDTDIFNQDYAYQLYIMERYKHGEIPYWNPHQGAGIPFLGTHQWRFFHPPHLLLMFAFGAEWGLMLEIFFSFLASVFGFYLLFRSFRLHPAASLLGTILVMGAWFSNYFGNTPVGVTLACLPWSLFYLRRLFLEPQTGKAILYAVLLALSLLGGAPQWTYFTVELNILFIAAYFGAFFVRKNYKRAFGFFLYLALSGLVALLLSLAQLIPTIKNLKGMTGLSLAQILYYGQPGAHNPFLIADFFYNEQAAFLLSVLSVGLPAVALFVLKRRRLFLVMTGLYACYTAIYFTGIVPDLSLWLIKHYRPMGTFRAPARIYITFFFLAAFLMAHGFHVLLYKIPRLFGRALQAPDRRRYFATISIILYLGLSVGMLVLAKPKSQLFPNIPELDFSSFRTDIRKTLLGDLKFRPEDRFDIICEFAPFPCFNLGSAVGIHQFNLYDRGVPPRQVLYQNRMLKFQPHPRDTHMGGNLYIHPAGKVRYNLELMRLAGISVLISVPNLYTKFRVNLSGPKQKAAFQKLPQSIPLPVFFPKKFLKQWNAFKKNRAAQLAYRKQMTALGVDFDRFVQEFEHPYLNLYRLNGVYPRAFLVQHVVASKSPEQSAELLEQELDLRRTVILEHISDATDWAAQPAEALRPAKILSHKPEEVTIAYESSKKAILVLTDTYDANWRASVDGKEVPIHPANLLFRGVEVPAGRHTVTFRYEPGILRIGIYISAFVWLLVFAYGCRVVALHYFFAKSNFLT